MRSAGLQSRRPWSALRGMRACPPAPTVPSSAVVRARSRERQLSPSTHCITAAPEVYCALCTDRLWSRYRGQPQRIDRRGACMTAKRSPRYHAIHSVGSSCVLVPRMQRWWWRHRASPKGSRDRIRGAILCSAFAHSSVESAAHAMDVVRAPIHAAVDASLWVNPVSGSSGGHQRKGNAPDSMLVAGSGAGVRRSPLRQHADRSTQYDVYHARTL